MTWKQVKMSERAVIAYAVGFDSKDYGGDKSQFCIFTPNGQLGRLTIFEFKKDAETYKKKFCTEYDTVRPVKIYVKY